MKASIIVAIATCGAVGYKNPVEKKGNPYLPWNIPEDMSHFSILTKTLGGVVIMGYTTWATLPKEYKVLPGRTLIVLTRDPEKEQVISSEKGVVGKTIVTSLISNVKNICNGLNTDHIWVAGGPSVYQLFLSKKGVLGFEVTSIHRTLVHGQYVCDARSNEKRRNLVLMPEMIDPLNSYIHLNLRQLWSANRTYDWGEIGLFTPYSVPS
jgi:dihydrofolate reductase